MSQANSKHRESAEGSKICQAKYKRKIVLRELLKWRLLVGRKPLYRQALTAK
jgi:hypothetical protein